MIKRQPFTIPLPGRAPLVLGERTLVMGIINVTPDSFADGGLRFDPSRAIEDGWRMLEDGADILDIGGESTRPGAEPLEADEAADWHNHGTAGVDIKVFPGGHFFLTGHQGEIITDIAARVAALRESQTGR